MLILLPQLIFMASGSNLWQPGPHTLPPDIWKYIEWYQAHLSQSRGALGQCMVGVGHSNLSDGSLHQSTLNDLYPGKSINLLLFYHLVILVDT